MRKSSRPKDASGFVLVHDRFVDDISLADMLQQIEYNLSYPNPINYLRRISKADGYDVVSRTVAKYFMESKSPQ